MGREEEKRKQGGERDRELFHPQPVLFGRSVPSPKRHTWEGRRVLPLGRTEGVDGSHEDK